MSRVSLQNKYAMSNVKVWKVLLQYPAWHLLSVLIRHGASIAFIQLTGIYEPSVVPVGPSNGNPILIGKPTKFRNTVHGALVAKAKCLSLSYAAWNISVGISRTAQLLDVSWSLGTSPKHGRELVMALTATAKKQLDLLVPTNQDAPVLHDLHEGICNSRKLKCRFCLLELCRHKHKLVFPALMTKKARGRKMIVIVSCLEAWQMRHSSFYQHLQARNMSCYICHVQIQGTVYCGIHKSGQWSTPVASTWPPQLSKCLNPQKTCLRGSFFQPMNMELWRKNIDVDDAGCIKTKSEGINTLTRPAEKKSWNECAATHKTKIQLPLKWAA